MKDEKLKALWNLATYAQRSPDADRYAIFSGLNRYASLLEVQPFDGQETTALHDGLPSADIVPSFQGLTEEILLSLRENVAVSDHQAIIAAWAEKLLRFCEVRRPILKQKALDKWKNIGDASRNIRFLTLFFLDYYRLHRDLRFLNVVLKLVDVKWIVDEGKLPRNNVSQTAWSLDVMMQLAILLILSLELNLLFDA